MTKNQDPNLMPGAWHGLALNVSLSLPERLGCALKALELYEAKVEQLQNEVRGLRNQEDFDPSPIITLYDQAVYRAEEEAVAAAAWRNRCVAQDQLLTCYRTGRNPSEKLHRELERTRLAIHALTHPETRS